ncbi:N-acetyltransferase [Actinocatenispora thailandica]|uniref:N-acetyltransferase n=1 Tax=Actinocatenispora thailandica TaxID=227318 RepID=UPI0031D1451C
MTAAEALVPRDFAIPQPPATDRYRLEPLGPQHNESDHAAWTASIEHIRATPGFEGSSWPPVDGMTLQANLADLRRHADDFERRVGFTYTVRSVPGGDVIGCVYIYGSRTEPAPGEPRAVDVRSWVRADRADLDADLYRVVRDWLAAAWPFPRLAYAPR